MAQGYWNYWQPNNQEVQSGLNGAPDSPDLILSNDERKASGIGSAYVDEYNQALVNNYNNAYNYWLWQQQMAYNSPAQQRKRLEEAGLNPNFNSIDGAGNAGSIPESRSQVRGNVRQNQLNAISSAVSVATGIAGAVGKGVGALKTIASTPQSIRFYRGLLTRLMGEKFEGSSMDNALKNLELWSEEWRHGLHSDPTYQTPEGGEFMVNYDAPYFQKVRGEADYALARSAYMSLQKDVMDWRHENLDPQTLDNMKAQWEYISAGTELRNLEINWKDPKEAMGILRTILPLVGLLFFKR